MRATPLLWLISYGTKTVACSQTPRSSSSAFCSHNGQLHREADNSPSRWPSEAVTLPSKLIVIDPHDFHEFFNNVFKDKLVASTSHDKS